MDGARLRYEDLTRRILRGEPGLLILTVGLDQIRPLVEGHPGLSCAERQVGAIREALVVGEAVSSGLTLAPSDGRSGSEGQTVAVCEISRWGVAPSRALQRARRADELLRHPLSRGSVGTIDPDTEVLRLRSESDRRRSAAEDLALGFVGAGDLASAGFVLFEVADDAGCRGRWLRGLVEAATEIAPRKRALRAAAAAMAEPELDAAELLRSQAVLRQQILRQGGRDNRVTRALYVAELAVKSQCNLLWRSLPNVEAFDRGTGWWILRSALAGSNGSEAKAWSAALFRGDL